MSTFDLNKLRLRSNSTERDKTQPIPERKVERKRRCQKFLKGPVPLPWLLVASKLPGKALAVGIAIWFRSGLTGSQTISLPSTLLSLFGVNRHSKRRALDALEEASLIAVDRRSGRNPSITIIEVPEEL